MDVIRLIRRMVYGLGFRPRPGTILHSPSYIDSRQTMNAWIEKGFEESMGRPYSQDDYERDKQRLESMLTEKNLAPGIITNVYSVPIANMDSSEEIMKTVRDIIDGPNWFATAHERNPFLKRDPYFFCPLCGGGLLFSEETHYYKCPGNDGYFDIVMGRNAQGNHELVVKTVKLDG
jgi:hypothetical protein